MALTITNFSGGVTEVAPSQSLIDTSNYLYSLCGKYSSFARNLIASGGTVAPVTPTGGSNIYPLYITSANFESDGISYNNANIVGDTLMIFVNEYSQQWFISGGNSFIYTATGIQVTLPGFDANTFDYSIVIQKANIQ